MGSLPIGVDKGIMLSNRSDIADPGRAYAALERIPLFSGVSRSDLRIERLSNSFMNASYRVSLNGDSFLLRLPGDGTSEYIDRSAEAHNARIAARAGVNAEVLFSDARDGTMLCRFVEGVGMDAGRFASDATAPVRAARALRRVHECGRPFASRFDPFEEIEAYLRLLRGTALPDDLGEILEGTERVKETLAAEDAALAPCHNDPWPGNFVDTGARMYLVDWEFSGMNDPMWDLADLSVEADFTRKRDERMLGAYFDGPPPRGHRLRFELHKPVSDLLWSLWGFAQNAREDPPEDFFAYALGRYERCKAHLPKPG